MNVAGSVDELLAEATDVTAIDSAGKSGAKLERVSIGGEPHVVKYLDPATDWTIRAAGIDGSATLELWRRGILAKLPASINQPIVGIAYRDGVTALLMRDVGDWLVPVSDHVASLEQRLRFLDHMAHMHATFWQTPDDIDVVTNRIRYLSINCCRLPQLKEDAIDAYRGALERHGVDTGPWWSRQLALCLLGGLVQLGWEKAFAGYDDELAWWERHAVEASDLL